MKKFFLVLLLLLIFTLFVGIAQAESPISLSHTLTSYTKGTDSLTLQFTLHLENMSDISLQDLRLSYLPITLITTKEIMVDVGNLETHDAIDISFTFITPMILNEDEILEAPFFWAGEYRGSDDKIIKFPAESITPE